jgi:hypothetical protein
MASMTSGRSEALTALKDWAARRSQIEAERARLTAAARNAGARTIAELARAAGVSRDTVYADLSQQGIDYHNKDADPRLTRLVLLAVAPYGNEDHQYLAPFLEELRAALGDYLAPIPTPPFDRIRRGRPAGRLDPNPPRSGRS